MPMRKIVNKETGVDPTDYVGELGEAWISDNDTLLRIGDGVTPGGAPVNNRLQNGAFSAPMAADGSITIPGTINSVGTMTLTGSGIEHTTWIAAFDDGSEDDNIYARAVAYDSQGNAYISWHYDFPGQGVWKLDPQGNKLWGKYIDSYEALGLGLAIDHHDNPIALQTIYSGGATAPVVTKFNGINGSVDWSVLFTDYGLSSRAAAIECDAAGDVFVAGYFQNTQANINEFLTVKLSGKDGSVIWSRGYNAGENPNLSFCCAVDSDGDVIVGGESLVPDYQWVTVFKLKGTDGSLVWSQDVYDPAAYGMDSTNGLIMGGMSVDAAGSVFFNSSWVIPGSPDTYYGITTKLDKNGVFQWGRMSDQNVDFVALSTATDAKGDTYSLSIYQQAETNYFDYLNVDNNYSVARDVYLLIKYDTQGRMQWQRFLANRQNTIMYKFYDFDYPVSGGTFIDVNDDYLLIGGTRYIIEPYAPNYTEDYYPDVFAIQMPKDGEPWNSNGWDFFPANVAMSNVTAPTFGSFEAILETVPLLVGPSELYYEDSVVEISTCSTESTPEQSIVIDSNGVNMDRPTVGAWTTYGNFDGAEGGNVWGNTYFYQLVRDAEGNVYASGGDQYNDADYITKINAQGAVEWSSSTNNMSRMVAVAVDPTTQNPVYVSLDGNEGFNVTAMNPSGAQLSTIHIPGSPVDWIYPASIVVNSKGAPVVAGSVYYSSNNYTGLTAREQSGADVLVVDKDFFNSDYPDYVSSWYIEFNSSYYTITDTNRWYNLASTTNHTGSGATWNVRIDPDANTYEVDQGNSGGAQYRVGDEVFIAGDLLLGDPVVNKITLTVTAVDNGGMITAWTIASGTPQTNYIKLVISTGGSVVFVIGTEYTVLQGTGEVAFVWTENWSRKVGTTEGSTNDYFQSVDVDSKDNIVAGGYLGSSPNTNTALVVKFDPEGNVLWKVFANEVLEYSSVSRVRVGPDDNVVVFQTPYDDTVYVSKLNGETGEFMWNVQLGYNQFGSEPYDGLDIDEQGFIYVGGSYYASSEDYNQSFLVVKIDPNGGMVYMRDMYSTYDIYNDYYGNTGYGSIAVNNGMMSLCLCYGYTPGDAAYQATVATLPADGSGHGTYGPWIYREIEYQYDHQSYGFDNIVAEAAAVEEWNPQPNPYDPPLIAEYYAMQDKLTGVMKQATGGQVALANLVFEDGSIQDTSGQDTPQVDQTKTDWGYYLLQLDDRGKHIFKHGGNIVVPTDAEVNFPIGSVITIATDNYTTYLYADTYETTTIIGVGNNSGTSSYTLAAYSLVTLMKVNRDYWMLSGSVFTAN